VLWAILIPTIVLLIISIAVVIVLLFEFAETSITLPVSFTAIASMYVANFISYFLSFRIMTDGVYSKYINVTVIVSLVTFVTAMLIIFLLSADFGMLLGALSLLGMFFAQLISYSDIRKRKV